MIKDFLYGVFSWIRTFVHLLLRSFINWQFIFILCSIFLSIEQYLFQSFLMILIILAWKLIKIQSSIVNLLSSFLILLFLSFFLTVLKALFPIKVYLFFVWVHHEVLLIFEVILKQIFCLIQVYTFFSRDRYFRMKWSCHHFW